MGFKNETWIEVRVVVPPDAVDAISGFFFERGSLGLTEEEGKDPQRGAFVLLRAYYESEAFRKDAAFQDELRAALLQAGAGKARIWVDEVPYGDWAEGWKQYFKPRKVGRRIVVAPTWEAYTPSGDEIVVRIDPGMAFGTGQHETTTLCVQALEDVLPRYPRARVLDVGTGSGILAICAVKLGATSALGTDNDPEAVTAAGENVAVNELGKVVEISGETNFQKLPGEFPIVVANILAETLIALAPGLKGRLAPGGTLILSGILAHLAQNVTRAYQEIGFGAPDVRRDGEWVCLVIQAPA